MCTIQGFFLGWLSIATKASTHPTQTDDNNNCSVQGQRKRRYRTAGPVAYNHFMHLTDTWESLAASNKTSPGSWYCETKIDELDEVQIIFCLLGLISVFLFVFLSICAIFPACWFVVEVIVAPNRESPRSQRTADRIADMTPRFRKGCSGELVGHWFVSSIIKSPWWC